MNKRPAQPKPPMVEVSRPVQYLFVAGGLFGFYVALLLPSPIDWIILAFVSLGTLACVVAFCMVLIIEGARRQAARLVQQAQLEAAEE